MVNENLLSFFRSYQFRLRSCENAIGIMTKLQTSLVAEETWVDGAAEKLSAALPTATSALELDVSICFQITIFWFWFSFQNIFNGLTWSISQNFNFFKN